MSPGLLDAIPMVYQPNVPRFNATLSTLALLPPAHTNSLSLIARFLAIPFLWFGPGGFSRVP